MSPGHEIDFDALINKTIRDFEPVKPLWPVRIRVFFWILLELTILALTGALLRHHGLPEQLGPTGLVLSSGLAMFVSIAAAFLALRGAVPGREVSSRELALLIVMISGTLVIGSDLTTATSGFGSDGMSAVELLGVTALPWSLLFWAVRRGVPLQPEKTGIIVGLAAFSFGLAVFRLIHYEDGLANQIVWPVICGILLAALSAVAGRLWLDWIDHWRRFSLFNPAEAHASTRWFGARTVFPVAIAASIVALIFVLQGVRSAFVPVPDFDLTIDSYERSMAAGFRPNVPSASIDSMAAAFVEHGMPAYMWDFGPAGFKFIGGRWQPLSDGTPVTYAWFRGATAGVICMMRQIDAFNPPPGEHGEYRNLLFYKYRGFSLCLINIGGYGNFISVIAAPIPMKQFVALVVQVVH